LVIEAFSLCPSILLRFAFAFLNFISGSTVASDTDAVGCRCIITGSTLVKCGQTQQKLGQAKRDLMQATTNNFLVQLKAFLDTDVKSIQVSVSWRRGRPS